MHLRAINSALSTAITCVVVVVAVAAVTIPDYYRLFSVFFVAVLLTQLIVLSPPKDVRRIFFIILASLVIEYMLLTTLDWFNTFNSYILLQICVVLGCVWAIEYQLSMIKKGNVDISTETLISSWTLIKFLKGYALPLEIAALGESVISSATGLKNLDFVYEYYEYFKVTVAAGLFILMYELFYEQKKETEVSF